MPVSSTHCVGEVPIDQALGPYLATPPALLLAVVWIGSLLTHVVKAWLPGAGGAGGWWELRRWGLVEGLPVTADTPWRRVWGLHPPSLLFFSFLTMRCMGHILWQ